MLFAESGFGGTACLLVFLVLGSGPELLGRAAERTVRASREAWRLLPRATPHLMLSDPPQCDGLSERYS